MRIDRTVRLATHARSLKSRFFPAILAICLLAPALTPAPLGAAIAVQEDEEAARQQDARADVDSASADTVEEWTGEGDVPPGAMNLEELSAMATAAVVLVKVEAGSKSRQGSGFIVGQDGLILTNQHVIRGATNATVRLSSGDVYDQVSVLASDERRDIAVLKVAGFALPTLDLGNSDSVRIGTDIVAIGSPLGLENTVSTGIVSGRRSEPQGFQLLQITAPASTGSSGGPVLARDGRVVGIAASQFRNGQNLNFAVPINYARGMLAAVDGQPLAVLGDTDLSAAAEEESREMTDTQNRVNRGLQFDLSTFQDHRLDLSVEEPDGALRRTRVTYRRIEDIAGGPPRIERYVEGESTRREDGEQPGTVRRERHRSIMNASDLAPISSRGEVERAVEGEWRRYTYDLRFDDGRVTGTVEDTAGVVRQIDREVPAGIVLRDMRDVAFAALAADRLIGRSMELRTFDAPSAELHVDRFDIRRRTVLEVEGEQREALAVDVASGLVNERAYYTPEVPRRLLRREDATIGAVEEVENFYVLPPPADDDSDPE